MAISDAQFATWLLSETAPRCVLVEASYRVPATGALGTEYMATLGFTTKPTDTPPNQVYFERVKAAPLFQQTMADLLTGRTQANIGTIEIRAIDATTDSWLLSRDWIGRSLAMYLGDPSWSKSDFRAIWSGVIGDFGLTSTNTFQIQARDKQHLLNQPCVVTTIATGPDAGKPWPQTYGIALNVSPVLLDAVTHQYAVHDGAVQSIDAVRADGVAVTFTASIGTGTFTLSAAATGTITADVHGAVVGGVFLQTASQLLQHFATVRGAFPAGSVDATAFATLATACPQPLNLFVQQVISYPYQLMDRVVATVGAFYAVNRDGLLYARQFSFGGASTLTIRPQDIIEFGLAVQTVIAPVARLTFRYANNWTPQQTLATTVTETNRATWRVQGPTFTLANVNAANYSKLVDNGIEESLFVNQSDANGETGRQMTLWGVPRLWFVVPGFTAASRVNLGDVVTLIHPRWGLSAGRTGIVVDIKERPSKKRVDLGILV